MKRILTSFRKGFSSAHEDELKEWSDIRCCGFWRYWKLRWLNSAIALFVATFIFGYNREDQFGVQFLEFLIIMTFVLVSFISVDYLFWLRKESKWRSWNQIKNAEQDAAPNHFPAGEPDQ